MARGERLLPARFRLANLGHVGGQREGVADFLQMGLMDSLLQALDELKIASPTPIQRIAIPALLGSAKRAVISAETGCGKTLSYMLPLMQKLKQGEAHGVPADMRAAILLPTNELVEQVHAVSKRLSHVVKLRVEQLGGLGNRKHSASCDLVISTPKKLLSQHPQHIHSLQHIVIDEADTLLCDEQFKRQLDLILERAKGSLRSLVYCSATITDAMKRSLSGDSVTYLITPGLHRPVPHVKHTVKLVKLPEEGRFQAVSELIRPHEKALIFCNSAAAAIRLHAYLVSRTAVRSPLLLHGGIPERQRSALLATFKAPGDQSSALVCTDLMARGVDLPAVRHVVLCGCPQSVADYLHRVGRVGRAGTAAGSCRVTAVIGGRQLPFVKRLEGLLGRPILKRKDAKSAKSKGAKSVQWKKGAKNTQWRSVKDAQWRSVKDAQWKGAKDTR